MINGKVKYVNILLGGIYYVFVYNLGLQDVVCQNLLILGN